MVSLIKVCLIILIAYQMGSNANNSTTDKCFFRVPESHITGIRCNATHWKNRTCEYGYEAVRLRSDPDILECNPSSPTVTDAVKTSSSDVSTAVPTSVPTDEVGHPTNYSTNRSSTTFPYMPTEPLSKTEIIIIVLIVVIAIVLGVLIFWCIRRRQMIKSYQVCNKSSRQANRTTQENEQPLNDSTTV